MARYAAPPHRKYLAFQVGRKDEAPHEAGLPGAALYPSHRTLRQALQREPVRNIGATCRGLSWSTNLAGQCPCYVFLKQSYSYLVRHPLVPREQRPEARSCPRRRDARQRGFCSQRSPISDALPIGLPNSGSPLSTSGEPASGRYSASSLGSASMRFGPLRTTAESLVNSVFSLPKRAL